MADNQRPPPSDLKGIMTFALTASANSSNEDNAQNVPTSTQPLDTERREWLEQVLSSMTINISQEMRNSIDILRQNIGDEDELHNKETALDNLLQFIDNVDFANDFYKMGGFAVLAPGLVNPNPSIRCKTGELIAELMQNNPFCQEKSKDFGLLNLLINVLDHDDDDDVRVKSLHALSCLLRQNPTALHDFNEHDGFSSLVRAMQSPVERLRVKSSFLISCLCSQQPHIKDTLFKMGLVVQLVALIQSEHDQTHEHIMDALCKLVTDFPAAIEECQNPELGLQDILEERINLLKGKDEFMEELDYCQQLFKTCFTSLENNNNNNPPLPR